MGSTVLTFSSFFTREGDGSNLRKAAFNDSSHQPINTSSWDAMQEHEPKCKLTHFRKERRDYAKSRILKTVFVLGP
jgi:hypothetical protein